MDEVGAVRKTWEGSAEDHTTSISEDIYTSQQKAGEHQLAEGKSGGAVTVDKNVSEDTIRRETRDPLKTSQQLDGDLSLPES